MQLFYNPLIDTETETFFFDKEESRHIVKVMRKQSGDKLFVTNGLGYKFTTEIVVASDNKCTVRITHFEQTPLPSHQIHLAVAPTKMKDRYEWFLEKATEMGITEITPLICDRSEQKFVKSDRLDKIVQSAMKQSLQTYLPKLNPPTSFKDFVDNRIDGLTFIAHCEPSDKKTLKSLLQPNTDVTIMIGPEGDFSEKEIKSAIENNFIPVSLGKTRLRTETAAVVACHSIVFVNE